MEVGAEVWCEMWGMIFTKAWKHDDDEKHEQVNMYSL